MPEIVPEVKEVNEVTEVTQQSDNEPELTPEEQIAQKLKKLEGYL